MRNWYRTMKNLALGPKGFGKSAPRSNSSLVVASTDVMPAVQPVVSSFRDEINTSGGRLARRDHFSAPERFRAEVRTGGSRAYVVEKDDETMSLSDKPSDRTRLRSKRTKARAFRNEVARRGSRLNLNDLLPPEEIELDGDNAVQ